MWVALLGLLAGVGIGMFFPYSIPLAYSKYMAVAILACLDSVFGGLAALMQEKFNMKIFISGFFSNALLAAGLAYIGDKLGADIYMAAVFAFGNRMFINFAIIRRFLLNKYEKKNIL